MPPIAAIVERVVSNALSVRREPWKVNAVNIRCPGSVSTTRTFLLAFHKVPASAGVSVNPGRSALMICAVSKDDPARFGVWAAAGSFKR